MNQPSVSDLLRGFAEVPESFDREIGQLALDSRDVRPGALFLATAGAQRHGIEFAVQAERAGALAIAWEPDPELAGELDALTVPVFAVPELGRRAGLIADRFYGSPSKHLQVLGVTGTNGKTSVSHFIAQALDGAPLRCGLIGTLGAGLFGELQPATHTTPDAIQVHRLLASFVAQGAGFAAMEVSSHALDQGRVNGVRFAVGIFTNLSRDHLDYHGDMGRYAAAKRRLFTEHSPRHAVINADDAVGRRLLQDLPSLVKPLAYSLRSAVPGIDTLYARRLHLTASGMVIEVESPWGSATFSSPLLGAFNAANLLAALGALLALGLPLREAIDRLAKVTAVAGRMERLGGGERPMVVIDYAHTPDALEQTLKALRAHTDGRLICVFGCGGDRDAGKRPLMGRCVEMHANLGIITDDNPRTEDPAAIVRAIKEGLMQPQRMPVVHDRRLAIVQALELARPGDCVLIAGKGHEDYQIVGHERRPFSDREVAHAWLEGRAT